MDKESNYSKYRGKCKEFVDAMIAKDSTLKAVRGHYYDAQWGAQEHWWAIKPDGTIIDPTALQFLSKGKGVYKEFDGWTNCAECGKEIHEDEVHFMGNYTCCSLACCKSLVGVY